MSKLGKFIVALALGLMMSLALLTTSFAQSAHPHVAHTPAHTAVTASANWGGCGGWGWGGCGGCGGWGSWGSWGGCGGWCW